MLVDKDEILYDVELTCRICNKHLPRVDHFFRLENHGWIVIGEATSKKVTFYCPEHKL